MKKKNVFILALAFVMGAIVSVPVFAEDNKVLSKKEITNLIKPEIKDNGQDNGKNYLKDSALDYLSAEKVEYFIDGESVFKCSVNKELNITKIREILKSKQKPNPCLQFDIMSYLIYNKYNDDLKKALDIGYNPRIIININHEKQRNLFLQAVLSNNKIALNHIRTGKSVSTDIEWKITSNNLVYKDLVTALSCLTVDSTNISVRIKMNLVIEKKEELKDKVITAELIKDMVIDGDWIGLNAAFKLLPSDEEVFYGQSNQQQDRRTTLHNALNLLIDYRVEHKY